jgi:hypothetical protein
MQICQNVGQIMSRFIEPATTNLDAIDWHISGHILYVSATTNMEQEST